MTTNSQFIAFNEFSATGKYPALFYYISIVLIVIYLSSFVTAAFGFWSTKNILNKWNYRNKCLMKLVSIVGKKLRGYSIRIKNTFFVLVLR